MSLMGIEFWHWWVLAIALAIGEVFVPGFVLAWMGAAAGVVGLVLLVAPELDWRLQLALFAVLSVSSIFVWLRYRRGRPAPASDHPTLNRRGQSLVGRHFTLDEPIVNGSGFARIDDTRWKIEGADLSAGSRVEVIGVAGTVLRVSPFRDESAGAADAGADGR